MAAKDYELEQLAFTSNGIGNLVRMPSDLEFGEVGFTADDRKMLYTVSVQHQEMYRQMLEWRSSTDRRLEAIEKERALKEDLDRMESRLAAALSERTTRAATALAEHDAALRKLEAKVTWIWAYAIGAAASIVFLIQIFEFVIAHKG